MCVGKCRYKCQNTYVEVRGPFSPTLVQHGLPCFCHAAPSRLAGPQASGQFLSPFTFAIEALGSHREPLHPALYAGFGDITRVIRLALQALLAEQSSQEPHIFLILPHTADSIPRFASVYSKRCPVTILSHFHCFPKISPGCFSVMDFVSLGALTFPSSET